MFKTIPKITAINSEVFLKRLISVPKKINSEFLKIFYIHKKRYEV